MREDGDVAWVHELAKPMSAFEAGANVIVVTQGEVVALDMDSGVQVWHLEGWCSARTRGYTPSPRSPR